MYAQIKTSRMEQKGNYSKGVHQSPAESGVLSIPDSAGDSRIRQPHPHKNENGAGQKSDFPGY